jgi:prepilin-type N-terminal cleavage/methylation domain-containing protein
MQLLEVRLSRCCGRVQAGASAARLMQKLPSMTTCQNPRRGFTLFEVLLVMAILVAVATVAVPIFHKSFEVERLRKAADVLRTAWGKARVQAMTTGQTHVFRFQYETNQYVVAVWDTGEGMTEASTATTVAERPGALPDGIVFHAAEKLADLRASETDDAGGQTAPQIFFFPDGTTSTAQVLITNNKDRFLKVRLRGMTGIAQMGEVVSAEELAQE